ncbi:MAG: gliding motility-associated C-terminal domain-containing protein [Bacteroidota bacterium]
MRRWLYVCILALLFPNLIPAQCLFLPTLQQDSSLVLSASSGAIVGNSAWFKSPTLQNTLTWVGNSVDLPADTAFISTNSPGLARYEFYVSPTMFDSGTPDPFLFSILAEPVSVDSLTDIWVNFSGGVEVWVDFPSSGLQQIGGGALGDVWVSLVSISSPTLPIEEIKGWELKYRNSDGELGDLLIIPQESGVINLQIHGDQPGYRYSQLLFSSPAIQADSSFLNAQELPISRSLPISVTTVDLLVDETPVSEELIQVCATDSFLLSADTTFGGGITASWYIDGELLGNTPQIQIGPRLPAGIKEVLLEIDGPDVCASGSLQIEVGEVGGTFQAEILSPMDGSIFCDTDVFLEAQSPGEGVQASWYESTGDPNLDFQNESDSTAVAITTELGPYDIVWEISQNGCEDRDTVSVFFLESIPLDAGEDVTICEGETVTIGSSAIPGLEYSWIPRDFLADPTASLTQATPVATTVYLLEAIDPVEECIATDIITVEVLPGAEFTGVELRTGIEEFQDVCGSNELRQVKSSAPFTLEFITSGTNSLVNWSVDTLTSQGVFLSATQLQGNGIISQSLSLLPNRESGTITYLGVYQDEVCGNIDTCSFTIEVVPGEGPILIPKAITPNGDAINDVWTILNMNANAQYKVQVFNRSGGLVFESENYAASNNWNAARIPDGSYWYRIEEINLSDTQTYTGGLYIQRNPR